MLIRYTQGPKAGTTSHVPRSQEIDVLLKAGIIEAVTEPLADVKVTWSVTTNPLSQRTTLFGTCSRSCGRFAFDGPPEAVKHFKFQHGCGATPPEQVPEEVVKQYAAIRERSVPVESPDVVEYFKNVHHKHADTGPRKLNHGNGWVE